MKRTKRVRIVERLEDRRMLASVWQNTLVGQDVNRDGHISPIDALVGINRINQTGGGQLGERLDPTEPFVDTNGDGFQSAIDSLLVINALNNGISLPLVLKEGNTASSQVAIAIGVGQEEGSRTYRFAIDAAFDTTDSSAAVEDTLAVYLRDRVTHATILDRGAPGTSLFTLSGDQADFTPGQVRFDGRHVEIDLTDIEDSESAQLVFQLINTDTDRGSQITIAPVANDHDINGSLAPQFQQDPVRVVPGASLDFTELAESQAVKVEFTNTRFDERSGEYQSELFVRNAGEPLGRMLAVEFVGLPSGVTMPGASGLCPQGNPYLNLTDAITFGGLDRGGASERVAFTIDTPQQRPFSLGLRTWVGGPNRPPVLDPIAPITVMPGDVAQLEFEATDPDGDPIRFSIQSNQTLPEGQLRLNQLELRPIPADVGNYEFLVSATDGRATATQTVTLNVVADPVTTTRISGVVLDTESNPIVDITVDLGSLSTKTDAQGGFVLEAPGAFTSDTLRIHGEEHEGADVFPFIAEKLPLLFFGREPIEGINNVINRPIYLPALDVANGKTIDPATDVNVTSEALPGISVFVAAGSLEDQSGNPFAGTLSITEVPADLTPAALPANLFPDQVVTVQPGEMVFTQPAPMTFANRFELPPGTKFNLWSINPITGDFDDVGDMQVSADGTVIETISGGVRNSSWHFPALIDEGEFIPLREDPHNLVRGCSSLPSTCPSTSRVEMHAGTLLETHDLPTYKSVGRTRGVSLRYDSARADGMANVGVTLTSEGVFGQNRSVATLELEQSGIWQGVAGTSQSYVGLPEGAFIWKLAEGATSRLAVQADLSHLPTGKVNYRMSAGRFVQGTGFFTPRDAFLGALRRVDNEGVFLHINGMDSAFGNGWGIEGLQQIIENSDGTVLLIDGDGSELEFEPPQTLGGAFEPPMGDFSILEPQGNGGYRRTLPDQTVYLFNAALNLESVTDRNGNRTVYEYDLDGKLVSIVDPVGLITTFNYIDDRVATIIDPASRETRLSYDDAGNLRSITDPDNTIRTFGYDSYHRMIAEVDKRGAREEIQYDAAGKVARVVLKDGTIRQYSTLQNAATTQSAPLDSLDAIPVASDSILTNGTFADSAGNLVIQSLDQLGQATRSVDSLGALGGVSRDSNNQIISANNARGQTISYEYDDRGNVVTQRERLVQISRDLDLPGQALLHGSQTWLADVNKDGLLDVLSVEGAEASVEVRLGEPSLQFGPATSFGVGNRPFAISAPDINGDGNLDVAVANFDDATISILLGDGTGNFTANGVFPTGQFPGAMRSADLNSDGFDDLVTINFSGTMTVLLGEASGSPSSSTTPLMFVQSLALEDFNGDQIPDLVTGVAPDSVHVAMGNGDGTFGTGITLEAGAGVAGVTTEDFDGDGNMDLASAAITGIVVHYGDGQGAFPEMTTIAIPRSVDAIVAGDFNGDGFADLAASGFSSGLQISSNGDRTFATPVQLELGEAAQSEDLDGDDVDDLITTDRDRVLFHFGNSAGEFHQSQHFEIEGNAIDDDTFAVAAGDFNQDGLTDLITIKSLTSDGQILLASPDGGYADSGTIDLGPSPTHVVAADIDNDGVLDLVKTGSIPSIIRGKGDGTFFERRTVSLGFFNFVQVAHLNNDPFLDLVMSSGSRVEVFLSNGPFLYSAGVRYDVGDAPGSLRLNDFNDDGLNDIATANDGSVSFRFNNGDGTFSDRTDLQVGGTNEGLVAGDFNFDGLTDLAILQSDNHTITVLLQRPDGAWSTSVELLVPGDLASDIGSIDLADMNGDSDPDLIVLNDEAVHVFLGDVNAQFDRVFSFDAQFAEILTSMDANSDGTLDIVTINPSRGSISVLPNGNSTTAPLVQRWSYDPIFNQMTSHTDELGRQTFMTVDPANGNSLAVIDVVGQPDVDNGETDDLTTTFSYFPNGLIESRTDALGRVSLNEYDAVGRLTSVTRAAGTPQEATTRFEYDTAGNTTATTDPEGNRTEFEFDIMNRVLRATGADPDGIGPLLSPVTTREYDANGNIVRIVDAANSSTSFDYDALNRVILTTDAELNTSMIEYDTEGNPVRIIDSLGRITERIFDARDRLVETIEADGTRLRFEYDLDDNRTRIVDASGNVTSFVYDTRGRRVRRIDATGESTRFTYDAADQLIQTIDRNGRQTLFQYDDLGRLASESWMSPSGETLNQIGYEYDAINNLLRINDSFSDLQYTYDALDRVITSSNSGTPDAPLVSLSYEYDAASNVIRAIDTVAGLAEVTTDYAYDALNRMIQITASGNGTSDKRVDLGYNELGQALSLQRFGDLAGNASVAQTLYVYDALNRIESIQHNSGETLASFEFQFDAASRMVSVNDIDGLASYTYDETDQLIVAARPGAPQESYAYDASGNRLSTNSSAPSVIGVGNRVLSDHNGVYQYDAEGNQIVKAHPGGTEQYSYDHRNRLVEVRQLSPSGSLDQTVSLVYDALNRRIRKSVATATGSQDLHFAYDGANVLLDSLDPDGVAGPSQPALDKRYLHGPLVDQVLAEETSAGDVNWLLTDHLGTVRDIVDNAGQIINHLRYDSFGNLLSQTDAGNETRYQFAGREFDDETDLYYNRARYYDASSGRFIAEDPIHTAGGDLNFYRYVSNQPTSFRDPTGLNRLSDIKDAVNEKIKQAADFVVDKAKEKVDKFLEPFRKRVAPLANAMDIADTIAKRNEEDDPLKRKQLEDEFVKKANEGTKDEIKAALLDPVDSAIKEPIEQGIGALEIPGNPIEVPNPSDFVGCPNPK